MSPEPICLHLVLDRPPAVPPGRWVDAWKDACGRRLLPDLRMFWIAPDQCRLSIEQGRETSANLEAVARVFASWAEAPRPARELIDA